MKNFITFLTTTALLLTLCACSAQSDNSALVNLADLADLTLVETVNSSAEPQPDTQNQDNSSGDEIRGDVVEREEDVEDISGEVVEREENVEDISGVLLEQEENVNDNSDDLENDDVPVAPESEFIYRPDGLDGVEIVRYIGRVSEVIIPETIDGMTVTMIGTSAFSYLRLTSVTIPDSVISIGAIAFYDCMALTEIKVSANNQHFTDIDGVLFNKTTTELIQYPPGIMGSYIIPNSVTSIGDNAFWHRAKLTEIIIPNSVASIGEGAFARCVELTEIIIPDSVTSIGGSAFWECTALASLTIPNSVKSIGEWAFSGCTGLTEIVIPDSVTSIGELTFANCMGLTEIIIPDSVTSIGNWAFEGCIGLTSIVIPDSVTDIGDRAFQGCPDLTIYGVSGSYAEEYADRWGIAFVAM